MIEIRNEEASWNIAGHGSVRGKTGPSHGRAAFENPEPVWLERGTGRCCKTGRASADRVRLWGFVLSSTEGRTMGFKQNNKN